MEIIFNSIDKLTAELFPPKPAKDFLPEWFESLPDDNSILAGSKNLVNLKSCLPVVDYINSGYIIFNSYEFSLEEKISNFENLIDIRTMMQNESLKDILKYKNSQCPIPHAGPKKEYFKIRLEWNIRTPAGYSCLLVQPFYHHEKRYTLLPSVIDTDSYDSEIFIAGYLNSKEIFSVMPGDPLIQIIPFKRDSWNMRVENKKLNSKLKHFLFQGYKKVFHKSKSFQ